MYRSVGLNESGDRLDWIGLSEAVGEGLAVMKRSGDGNMV